MNSVMLTLQKHPEGHGNAISANSATSACKRLESWAKCAAATVMFMKSALANGTRIPISRIAGYVWNLTGVLQSLKS